MRDGAMHVTFFPRLSAAQYAELMEVVEKSDTKDELRSAQKGLAKTWGSRVALDEA
jgi:hypothetical protein